MTTNVQCDRCGAVMVERRNGQTGQVFYGCANFRNGCRNALSEWAYNFEASIQAFKPTDEQAAIIGAASYENFNIQVAAGAGTGKSTTALHIIKVIYKLCRGNIRIQYTCFNRDIKKEFTPRAIFEGTKLASVGTMHGYGYISLIRHFKKLGYEIAIDADDEKDVNISKDHLIASEFMSPEDTSFGDLIDLIGHVKNQLIDINSETYYDRITDVCHRFDINPNNALLDAVRKAVARSVNYVHDGKILINFDDMIWLPCILETHFDAPDILIIDESQDLNPCQHALTLRMANGRARIIAIGDTFQAIYGFRGADCHSMETMYNLMNARDNRAIQLPLTKTRRCGKAIVAEINRRLPEIPFQALPDAPDGEVLSMSKNDAIDNIASGDMVLCPINAPLVSYAFALLKRGVPAVILGRKFGKTLVKFIKSLKAKSIPDLRRKATAWRDSEVARISEIAAKAAKRPNPDKLQSIEDQVECIIEISKGCKNVDMVIDKIVDLFKEVDEHGVPAGAVKLSTVHKAKGMEADRVFCHAYELLPSPYAKTEEDIRQGRNCLYVMLSRAKHSLILIQS